MSIVILFRQVARTPFDLWKIGCGDTLELNLGHGQVTKAQHPKFSSQRTLSFYHSRSSGLDLRQCAGSHCLGHVGAACRHGGLHDLLGHSLRHRLALVGNPGFRRTVGAEVAPQLRIGRFQRQVKGLQEQRRDREHFIEGEVHAGAFVHAAAKADDGVFVVLVGALFG